MSEDGLLAQQRDPATIGPQHDNRSLRGQRCGKRQTHTQGSKQQRLPVLLQVLLQVVQLIAAAVFHLTERKLFHRSTDQRHAALGLVLD